MIEKITQLKAELNYIESHKNVLKEDLNKLSLLEKEVNEKKEILLKENKDVEVLEKMSFQSLFHSILGNKEEKLDKERYEASLASLAYQRVLFDYNLKKEDVERLKKRVDNEENIIKELEELQLTVNRENTELLECRDQMIQLQLKLKELDEAIQTGTDAQVGLVTLQGFLKDANTWSTVDVLSDNIFADMIKRDSLQKAQEHLQIAQSKIERFEIELKDVKIGAVELPEISDFDYVIDVWFDNIFTDYSIKSQIKQSLDKVSDVLSTVESLLNDLNNQRKEVNSHLEESLKKLKNLLTTL